MAGVLVRVGTGVKTRAGDSLRALRGRLLSTACVGAAALTVGVWSNAAQADDVNITTSTNNGIVLDGFAGTTARVLPGVTVSNTTTNFSCPVPPAPSMSVAGVCASTRAWTLTNQGTIGPSDFGDAVHFTAGGAVINSGSIEVGVNGSNGVWIQGGAGGSVDNQLGGTIHGRFGAIVIGTFAAPVPGTVTNAGTITSDGQAIGLNGGTVTNLATGIIIGHGGSNAVSLVQGASRTVINSGYIQSNDSGFATGVAIQIGTLTNNAGGQILGAFNGVWANGAGATSITNSGYIEASKAQGGGSAIEVDAGGTVVNSGTIRSFTSNATITDSGVNFTGAGSITNRGTIQSTSGGRAIVFNGAGIHTLNLDTGSVLGGNVQGGTGIDNLVLTGTGTEAISKFLSFETLSMQGGDWSVTGTGAFTTSTTVQSGLLRVNGILTSPTVTVAAGGTLGGGGTIVGAVTVNGNIAPGNSIGTLNITGPYLQATGSTYTPEVNITTSDLINVTGAATIQGGTTVNVVVTPGFYTLGKRYTILTASLGVTGQYTTLTDNGPFVDFQLASDPNNIYLDVIRSSVSFQQVAQTPNQKAAASGLETLPTGNAVFNAAIMLDAPNALRAFDLLSGEIHASITGTLLEGSRFIRDVVTGRLRQFAGGAASIFAPQIATLNLSGGDAGANALAFDSGAIAYAAPKHSRVRDTMDRALVRNALAAPAGPIVTAWGQTFGNWGHTAGDGNAAALSRSTGGVFTGMDATIGGARSDVWRFGLAGGYQHTSVNVGDRSSSGGIDSYHVAAYAGVQHGALGVRVGSAYGWHDIGTSRTIAFPGFSDATRAGYGARTAQTFAEVGYGMTYRQFAFEPFASLAHVNVRTGSFTEAGGPAALAGAGGSTGTTYSTLGLRAATRLPWLRMDDLIAKASVGWRHAFGTVTPTAQLAFASGSAAFVVAGVPIARDAATVELGLDGRIAHNTTLGVAYTGQLAGSARDHGITANVLRRF